MMTGIRADWASLRFTGRHEKSSVQRGPDSWEIGRTKTSAGETDVGVISETHGTYLTGFCFSRPCFLPQARSFADKFSPLLRQLHCHRRRSRSSSMKRQGHAAWFPGASQRASHSPQRGPALSRPLPGFRRLNSHHNRPQPGKPPSCKNFLRALRRPSSTSISGS